MEKDAFELNRGTAVILATACIAMALLSTSYGGGGSTAADPISAAGFSVSPTTVTFGNQAVGITSTTRTATLTNAGTATLNISSFQVTGPNASDYSAINSCGSSLAPSAQCAFNVALTPSAAGAKSIPRCSISFAPESSPNPSRTMLLTCSRVKGFAGLAAEVVALTLRACPELAEGSARRSGGFTPPWRGKLAAT
jgi:hypothetical protein